MSPLLAAALAAVALSGAGDSVVSAVNPPPPTDAQLAGARVVTGFSGRHPSKGLRKLIRKGAVGGVILFDGNVGSRRDARRLTRELQSIPRPQAVDRPLIVSTDQEGGLVRRLPGPPSPSASSIGARGAGYAQNVGAAAGRSLRRMGINVDLAPVLDLGRPGRVIDQEQRAFARTPDAVSAIGGAFARGLQGAGVAATAKHFPGLGDAEVNTDNAVQSIGLSAETLRSDDERPFADFAAAGGSLVMLSTANYPSLADRPAAFAREIATGELRDRVGFRGVSITDALGGAAARAIGGPQKTARAAAAAGADLVLYTSLGDAARAQRALVAGLGDGSLDRAEFQASVDRALALRARFGR